MTAESRQKRAFQALAVVCGGSLCLVFWFLYLYMSEQRNRYDVLERDTQRLIDTAANELDEAFNRIQPDATALAQQLSTNGDLKADEIRQALKRLFEEHEDNNQSDTGTFALKVLPIFEAGVAYDPAVDDPQKLCADAPSTKVAYGCAPHYGYQGGQRRFFRLDQVYDYTQQSWYRRCLDAGASRIEPYFGSATQAWVTGYCVPFFALPGELETQDARPIGVVRINFSLESIRTLVSHFAPGRSGYGLVFTPAGRILTHALDTDLTPQEGEQGAKDTCSEAAARLQLPTRAVLHTAKIPKIRLCLGLVSFPGHLSLDDAASRQRLTWLQMVGVVFLLSLGLLLCRANTGIPRRLWHGVVIAAGLFSLVIGTTWYLTYTISDYNTLIACDSAMGHAATRERRSPAGIRSASETHASGRPNPMCNAITDEISLKAFLDYAVALQAQAPRSSRQEKPIFIPTGVFLQSIEFSSANNIIMTGYLWQRYDKKGRGQISRGFVFPEAESIEVDLDKPAYRRQERNEEVIGWHFRVTLRQNFNYDQYPLDRVNVWIRIWHQDFDRNVILVPDFAAYDHIAPTSRPGLEADFVLPGWTIIQSFFSYRLNSYNTNFGIQDYIGQHQFPELYFTVRLRRNFISPFIANVLPLAAVAFMLFATLMAGTKHENRAQLLGFDAIGVLGICAAFFFTVLVAHVTLRSQINAEAVLYIEYFYFVMYLAVLAVAVNALLFTGMETVRFIQYRDNLLPKLLYWPLLLGAMLGVTLVVFY